MPDRPLEVRVDGLRELRRDLRRLGGTTNRELSVELKKVLVPIVAEARQLVPRRTGRLAASIKPYARGTTVGVRSNLPYANVVHWGGTITPRGTAIRFPRTEFITRAVNEQDDQILDDIGDAVERAAKKLGWH